MFQVYSLISLIPYTIDDDCLASNTRMGVTFVIQA